MPNHFHLLVKQKANAGISTFTSKLTNSFTKYFNTKNDRVGPLFQGQFKAVLVESDEQLIHLSRYIHLNPLASNLVKNLDSYEWSSLPAYGGKAEGSFVSTKNILSYFSDEADYKKFVLNQAEYAKSLERLKHKTLE
jgi:putative transposase